MTEKFKQTIKENLLTLPEPLQKAINFLNWVKITEEIGKSYNFTEFEINTLQVETGLILVGLADIEEYSLNIENNVGLSKKEAKNITTEIEKKVFEPIYKLLAINIKNNLNDKKIKLNQNIDFILSGGNYSTFLE